ncbi:TPA: MFS transporter [Candidatus Poribacteria bacterium]|nr:MFS transporter [Candidatus Poribacteria bacterium]
MGKYLSRDLKILSIAFFFIFMGSSFQQFLIPYLQKSTSWSAMKCSVILMVVYSTFLFWRVFVNYTIKWLGDYVSIFLGSLTYSGFMLSLYLTKQYPLIILSALIWGWGAAALWITSSSQVLDASRSSQYGMASGIFYCATHLGFAFGVLLLGNIGERFSGDHAVLTACLAIVIGNIIILFIPKRNTHRESRIGIAFTMMLAKKIRIVSFLLFASSLSFGLMLGAFTGVAEKHGFAYLAGTAVFAPIARAVLSLVGGFISDKLGRGKTLFISFAISTVGLASAGIWSNIVTLAFSALSLGLQGGLVPVSAMAIIGDSVNTERRHLAFSATFVWRDLGVVLSLFFGQYISSKLGGFNGTFIIFAGIFLICALISLSLIKHEKELV